jgi:hypothetical protein
VCLANSNFPLRSSHLGTSDSAWGLEPSSVRQGKGNRTLVQTQRAFRSRARSLHHGLMRAPSLVASSPSDGLRRARCSLASVRKAVRDRVAVVLACGYGLGPPVPGRFGSRNSLFGLSLSVQFGLARFRSELRESRKPDDLRDADFGTFRLPIVSPPSSGVAKTLCATETRS